jgi:hypothetical protein
MLSGQPIDIPARILRLAVALHDSKFWRSEKACRAIVHFQSRGVIQLPLLNPRKLTADTRTAAPTSATIVAITFTPLFF